MIKLEDILNKVEDLVLNKGFELKYNYNSHLEYIVDKISFRFSYNEHQGLSTNYMEVNVSITPDDKDSSIGLYFYDIYEEMAVTVAYMRLIKLKEHGSREGEELSKVIEYLKIK